MASATGFRFTHVVLPVALVTGLFRGLRLKSGRGESLKMRFCVSDNWNSSVFLYYLSMARSNIIR